MDTTLHGVVAKVHRCYYFVISVLGSFAVVVAVVVGGGSVYTCSLKIRTESLAHRQ